MREAKRAVEMRQSAWSDDRRSSRFFLFIPWQRFKVEDVQTDNDLRF